MSDKAAAPSGMLNAFLHQKHAVAEDQLYKKKSSTASHSQRANQTAKPHNDEQAVKKLDKQMRDTTDARMLREERKTQKAFDNGRGVA